MDLFLFSFSIFFFKGNKLTDSYVNWTICFDWVLYTVSSLVLDLWFSLAYSCLVTNNYLILSYLEKKPQKTKPHVKFWYTIEKLYFVSKWTLKVFAYTVRTCDENKVSAEFLFHYCFLVVSCWNDRIKPSKQF